MTHDEYDMTAAELALGVLEGAERATALRRVLAEPNFATEVAWWRQQLGTLQEETPATPASAGLFERIERSLEASASARRPTRMWPWVAGLTSLAAAAMLALLMMRPEPSSFSPQAPALLAAAITPVAAGTPLSAVYDRKTGVMRVSAATLAKGNRSAELWVIGRDGVPHSLGLLSSGAITVLPVAPANQTRLAATAVLAVSIEPVRGSPTGSPTGPVVAKGVLAQT